MIRLAIAGAAGRMGQTILGMALKDRGFKMVGATERADHPFYGHDLGELVHAGSLGVTVTDDLDEALADADAFIDFTHPSATPKHLKAAVRNKTHYVLGTTGLPAGVMGALRTASKKIGIVQSPNMSIGVNLLFNLAEITGKALGEDYDIEIVETHHRMKKDAPSGTAMKLLEVLAAARKRSLKKDTVYGRKGETGARPKGQIGVLALRGGDVVGDHTVSFLGGGERIELTHRASSREAFAGGALLAAKFLSKKRTGLYTMGQVLGLS